MIEYINLQMSRNALHRLDELYQMLDNELDDKRMIQIVASIAGILQTIIKHNRYMKLIPS